MKPKYLWPVLLGLAAGCGGAGTTDGGQDAGEASAEGESTTAAAAAPEKEAPAPVLTEPEKKPEPPPAPKAVDRPEASDFEINDLDGAPVTLSGLKGKVVLLAFWGID